MKERIETLDHVLDLRFQTNEISKQRAEIDIRRDIGLLQNYLIAIQGLQEAILAKGEERSTIQRDWQIQLQASIQSLVDCSQHQLNILISKKSDVSTSTMIPTVLSQMVSLVGYGIAGAFGSYVALRTALPSNSHILEENRTMSSGLKVNFLQNLSKKYHLLTLADCAARRKRFSRHIIKTILQYFD
jgi:hypothetical protein